MRPIKESARRHGDGSPGTLISGSPWSKWLVNGHLAAYYWNILMCSVLCQFFLRERTRHATVLLNQFALEFLHSFPFCIDFVRISE